MDTIPRITRRCELEDLPHLGAGIADGLLRKVLNRITTNSLESSDRYLSVPVPKMFTEHQGGFRAVTWFDDTHDVVWICAAGYHYPERDEHRDVYESARRLHERDRLLPTREDYASLEAYKLEEETRRAGVVSTNLRQEADAAGMTTGTLLRVPLRVSRIDADLYDVRFPQSSDIAAIMIIASAMFPDHLEIEWSAPERDSDGVLRQSIIVLVRD